MLPGKRTNDGAIYITQGPPPAGTPLVGGIAISHMGVIYVSQAFADFAPVNVSAPVVTGNGTPGQTLTSGTGAWSAQPAATYTYQWKVDGVNISGQTANTYVVQAGDVDKTITCAVTATNTIGSATATSNGILITTDVGQPPVNTVAPTISGTATVGSTLTLTSQGTWTGTAPITYAYNWQRDGVSIGSTGSSYVVQLLDSGKTITCRVTATNVDGVTNASSNSILIAASQSPVNTVAPVISGNTLVGSVLSCTQGTWTGDAPITYTYQWKKNTINISGQTNSTYTSVAGDVGATITCMVTGTNVAGNASATSNGIVVTAAFSPASLFASGEQGAWYDPSDLTTMFQDRAGTTPVTADGQTVGKILDKSGRGNHAVAPSDAARPLYKTSAGLHWLQFDGVDDRLGVTEFNMLTTITLWMGQSLSSNGTNLETSVNPGSATNALSFEWFSGSYFCGIVAPLIRYVYSLSAGTAFTLAMKFLIGQTDSAVIPEHSINGSQTGALGGSGTTVGSFGNFPITIGGRYGGTECTGMKLYSIVFLCDDASAQEIADTETWVNTKTGAY